VDLEFTSHQDELRDSVRSFLQKECPIELVRSVVETGQPAGALWRSMVQLDWPALAVPEAYGGVGFGFVETAVVAEELGRAVAPGPLLATMSQFTPAVRELGSPEQRARFLGQVARGEITGTLALADHPRRWGMADVRARAERDGDEWVLHGHKQGVVAALDTDEVAVAARTGVGPEEVGVFVVPGSEAGLGVVRSLDASRPLCTVTLDGARVGHDRVLGEPGSADVARGLRRAVEEATVAMALETVGACDELFHLVLAYVKDRKQFGVPVGSFQAIKHKMADMFVALERARALCYYAVAAIAEDAPERSVAAAMAKSASDDCQHMVCQESLQSFGGIGFTWEHDCHLYIKRAKSSAVLFGGAAWHTLSVAADMGVMSTR